MAKYEDYAAPQTLEAEIQQASTDSENRSTEIPSQFVGKSAEEVARSYNELKAMTDRQANELGELRRTTSNLTDMLQNSPTPQQEQHVQAPVTADDLYTDPTGSISRIVHDEVSGKLDALEQGLSAILAKGKLDDMEEKYPGYRDEARSVEMQEWLKGSGYRSRLAASADSGDLQAADDLFSMYYDLTGKGQEEKVSEGDAFRSEETRQRRQRELNAAGLESGTTDTFSPVEKFSRAKLELARIRAKRGNGEAEAYLKANKDAIFRAYQEGRIVN